LTSVSRFDWEAAAKRDYVARHGSISYRGDLASGKDRLDEREVALRFRLQRAMSLLDEYARLPTKERQNRYHLVLAQIRQRCDEERRRLRMKEPRLERAIDEYGAGLVAILDGLRPRPPAAPGDQ
jgi:hypothetical protein